MAKEIDPSDPKQTRVAIIGPGGIGGFLAVVLKKIGCDVTIIARPNRVESLREKGILLESKMFGRIQEIFTVEERLETTTDIIFITTKAYSLRDALASISQKKLSKETLIIPLLNGVEHYDILHAMFPNNAISGTISIESFQKETGVIHHTSSFARIMLAADTVSLKQRVEQVATLIKKAGLECSVSSSEKEILWKKLVRLSAVSLSTAATHLPIGKVRTDPKWRPRLLAIVSEACSVAELDGIHIEPTLEQIDGLDSGQLSSLERDVREKKQTELENIAGDVVRKAHLKKIEVSTIEAVMDEIRSQYKTTRD